MYINNKTSLKNAYLALRLFETMDKNNITSKTEEYIKNLKASIREYNKQSTGTDKTIVKDYGFDGFIELFELPDVEDPVAYFEENEYIHCEPSQYDCTGQSFTGWYKIFKRRGKNMVYHRVCTDC